MVILLIILLLLLPFGIMFCISQDNLERYRFRVEKRLVYIFEETCIVLGWLIVMAIIDPKTIIHLISMHGTAQELIRFCIGSIVVAVYSIVATILVKVVLNKNNVYIPLNKQTKCIVMLFVICISSFSYIGFYYGNQNIEKLHLQAVCRKTVEDDEEYTIVEIKNNGNLACETKGILLATDENEPKQYLFETQVVENGAISISKIEYKEFADIHKQGGTIVKLFSQTGKLIDSVELPKMDDESVYRLCQDGWKIEDKKNIDKENDEDNISKPVFSADSGFYDEDFKLKISADSGMNIYYTLDGSVPTKDSKKYRSSISIHNRSGETNKFRSIRNIVEDYLSKDDFEGDELVDKCTVVRAIAIADDGTTSDVVTKTYFVGLDNYKDKMVVSMVVNPEELFGDNGIYVTGKDYDEWYEKHYDPDVRYKEYKNTAPEPNFKKHGIEWERAASIEVFENAKSKLIKNVGIRILGHGSRGYKNKRFSVFFRKQYGGNNSEKVSFLKNHKVHTFSLRNGVDNAVGQKLSEGRDVGTLQSVPVYLFLNGEFWEETFIQERYSEAVISENYNVNKNNIILVKLGGDEDYYLDEAAPYRKFLDEVGKLDCSKEEDYEYLNSIMDIQSYIDYACIQTYMANVDANETLNVVVWKTKINELSDYGDTRWRWCLYDLDAKRGQARNYYSYDQDEQINTFTDTKNDQVERYKPLLKGSIVWEALRQNPKFCKDFVLSFMDIMNTNFSDKSIVSLFENWNMNLGYGRHFYRDRASYITKYMAEEFELTGTQENLLLTVNNPKAGEVKLNSIMPDLSEESWNGTYYTDYPVTLTATPKKGHSFKYWEVDGKKINDQNIEVTIKEGGTDVHAVFK